MSEVLKVNGVYTTFDGYEVTIKSKYAEIFLAEVEVLDNTYQVAYNSDGECITFPKISGFNGSEFDIVIEPEDLATEVCHEACQDECCDESCEETCSPDSCANECRCKNHDRQLIKLISYRVVENLNEMFIDITDQIKLSPSNKVYWDTYNSILSNMYMWISKIEQIDR